MSAVRMITETARRWQTSKAIRRRLHRAYDAMARRADLAEARCPGGWFNMCGGPAYDRWMRVRAHELVCKHVAPIRAYRLLALDEAGRDVRVVG